MSVNLLKLLQEYLSGDVVSNLAALIGESPKNTELAVQNALPSLLAGLVTKSSDSSGLNSLFNLIANENHDGGLLSNLGALSRGGEETDKLIATGSQLLSSLFGEKAAGLSQLISNVSGISAKASNSLLSFAAPVVLGLIGKMLKLENIGSANGLAALLKDQSSWVNSLLPAGLGGLFAFGSGDAAVVPSSGTTDEAFEKAVNSLDSEAVSVPRTAPADQEEMLLTTTISDAFDKIEDKVENAAEAAVAAAKEAASEIGETASRVGATVMDEGKEFAQSAAAAFDDTEETGSKVLPWLLVAAALALLWGLLKSCGTEEKKPETAITETPVPAAPAPTPAPATPEAAVTPTQPSAQSEPAKVEPATLPAPAVETSSDFFEKTLSTGYAIKAAKDGFESKIISFIESSDPISEDLWFNMNGIQFDTAKATIRPESQDQINHIAEILKAYPNVKIKIGGYTDNTGKAASNLKLSDNRANAVKKALVAKGIDKSRLDAEGYGSEHPVASNDTEEGKQQNRRIDVRVTQK